MLQHNGRRFRLYPYKAKFNDKQGNPKEKYALPSKEWWESAAQRQGFDVEFEEITLTEEQQERYEQIKDVDVSESQRSICIDYILDGDIEPEDEDGNVREMNPNHPLREVWIDKSQKQQDQDIADAFFEIMLAGGE